MPAPLPINLAGEKIESEINMFDNVSYYELDKIRDMCLKECAGLDYDDSASEILRTWIEMVSQEMEHRESMAVHRMKLAVWVVNILVLAVILFIAGCNAVQGIGRDITWMGEAGQQMLEHGHEAMNK